MSPPRGASCCFSSSPTTWCQPTWSGRPWPIICRNSAAPSPCRGASRQRRSARMPRSLLKPVLFFDFDNTLMQGDILDEVIEKYSPNEAWRDWEDAWAKGHLPARDCLRLQVENMRVSRERLFEDLTRVRIDPAFAEIVEWEAAADRRQHRQRQLRAAHTAHPVQQRNRRHPDLRERPPVPGQRPAGRVLPVL